MLAAHDHELLRVDLHRGVPRLGRPWEEIEERRHEVRFDTTRVSVTKCFCPVGGLVI